MWDIREINSLRNVVNSNSDIGKFVKNNYDDISKLEIRKAIITDILKYYKKLGYENATSQYKYYLHCIDIAIDNYHLQYIINKIER